MSTGYLIAHHSCEWDTHDCNTTGPFATKEEADAYIEAHYLHTPQHGAGGYAFALVIGPEDLEGPTGADCGYEECSFCYPGVTDRKALEQSRDFLISVGEIGAAETIEACMQGFDDQGWPGEEVVTPPQHR